MNFQFTDEQYFLDLREALLRSHEGYAGEQEKGKPLLTANINAKNQADNKASKKKKKPATVPLDEFLGNSSNDAGVSHSEGVERNQDQESDVLEARRHRTESENALREEVADAAERIMRFEFKKEEMKAELNKRANESVVVFQFKEELKKRDAETKELRQEVEKLREELKAVKSRNRKLCLILGSGESKQTFN